MCSYCVSYIISLSIKLSTLNEPLQTGYTPGMTNTRVFGIVLVVAAVASVLVVTTKSSHNAVAQNDDGMYNVKCYCRRDTSRRNSIIRECNDEDESDH
jgi:hypothetical protein